jgi:hypothetical protein
MNTIIVNAVTADTNGAASGTDRVLSDPGVELLQRLALKTTDEKEKRKC